MSTVAVLLELEAFDGREKLAEHDVVTESALVV